MSAESKLHLHGKPVEGFHEVHEHISPISTYMKVFGGLLVLTGLTYAVSYMSLGPASLPVAMLVAVAKATLVCMYFMHLKYDDRYHVFMFLSTLIFVGIFFTFTMFDLDSRARLSDEQGTFFLKEHDRDPPPRPKVTKHGEHGEGDHAEGKAEGDHAEGKAEGKAEAAH